MKAALAAEALTEQVAHRLMALTDDRLMSHGVSEGGEVVPDVHVYDDVLPDPEGYRALALAHVFQTFTVGEVQWNGFAECEPSGLTDWLHDMRPDLTATLSLLRQSPEGQAEPHYIHTDRSMGDWTAILYLTPSPQAGTGPIFGDTAGQGQRKAVPNPRPRWRRKPTRGAIGINGPCDDTSRPGLIAWFCFRRHISIPGPCARITDLEIRPD